MIDQIWESEARTSPQKSVDGTAAQTGMDKLKSRSIQITNGSKINGLAAAYKEKLENETQKAEEELAAVCGELSELRKNYGKQLEERIIQGLQDLNFLDVKFEINFEITEHYTANGNDKICFTISTNPGEPLRPLAKVVSGGDRF